MRLTTPLPSFLGVADHFDPEKQRSQVRELQYAKKNSLLNSKRLREFVLQKLPLSQFQIAGLGGYGGISAGSSLPLISPWPYRRLLQERGRARSVNSISEMRATPLSARLCLVFARCCRNEFCCRNDLPCGLLRSTGRHLYRSKSGSPDQNQSGTQKHRFQRPWRWTYCPVGCALDQATARCSSIIMPRLFRPVLHR